MQEVISNDRYPTASISPSPELSCEHVVQVARAKPKYTSCPDQAVPSCPNR
jgi:hypothetical protein